MATGTPSPQATSTPVRFRRSATRLTAGQRQKLRDSFAAVQKIDDDRGYGYHAGKQLRENFDWDAHRWTRYVISMARLDGTLEDMKRTYDEAAPLDEDLAHALERYLAAPSRYKQTKPWRDVSKLRTESLMREAAEWAVSPCGIFALSPAGFGCAS